MTRVDATTPPTEHGWYVCWLEASASGRPIVLYWGKHTSQWRYGATLMPVVSYMGPLPE